MSSTRKKSLSEWVWKNRSGYEARELLEPSDQHQRETDETDDAADADLALAVELGAEREDRHDRQRARRAIGHRQPGPAAQHRILRGKHALRHLADRRDLVGQAVVALHDQHVAEHVAGALGDRVVQFLDLALRLERAPHRDRVEHGEADHQRDHQQRELPVDLQRQRHHDDDRQQRRQVLAEESEPQAEQVAACRRA